MKWILVKMGLSAMAVGLVMFFTNGLWVDDDVNMNASVSLFFGGLLVVTLTYIWTSK